MRNNPSSSKGKGSGDKKGFGKDTRGKSAGGFKKSSDRPYSGRKTDDGKPTRSFSRDGEDKPKRSFDKDSTDRPKRSFDKPLNKDRKFDNDRPKRSFDKDGDRPKRSFDKDGDRPKRSFDRDSTDRPKRSFDKPFNKDRKFDSDRPKRSFDKDGDRPKRSFDGDSTDRPKRSFDKPFNKDRKFDNDRPKRSFDKDGDRPARSFEKDKKFGDDKKGGRFKKDDRPESQKRFSERNVFKEDKPEKETPDYEKNFVTPKEFEKTLVDKPKLTARKGTKQDENFEKAFPLGTRKVSGPFRKNEAEKFEKEKKAYFEKKVKPKPRYDEDGDEIDYGEEVAESKDMTLNKYIAHSGVTNRREAAAMVKQGKVKVNDELMLDPGYRVTEFDVVSIAGKKLTPQRDRVYVLLNKPKGYITTTDDPQDRDTVMDLVEAVEADRLYPVGRLDRNTSGLLLLTNDGDLAQKLSHPSYETKKVYQVTLNKPLLKKDLEAIAAGLTLEDGEVKVDEISYLDEKNEIGVEIHSGRNRIVRRIFESLGYEVEKLDRVMYAGLTKKNLPRGKWRLLVEKEIIMLKHFKI
jgi:23S rRNA pseudouridine2605 synthase